MCQLIFFNIFFTSAESRILFGIGQTAPYGLLSRIVSQGLLTLKITRDDSLEFLYRYTEPAPNHKLGIDESKTDILNAAESV